MQNQKNQKNPTNKAGAIKAAKTTNPLPDVPTIKPIDEDHENIFVSSIDGATIRVNYGQKTLLEALFESIMKEVIALDMFENYSKIITDLGRVKELAIKNWDEFEPTKCYHGSQYLFGTEFTKQTDGTWQKETWTSPDIESVTLAEVVSSLYQALLDKRSGQCITIGINRDF